MAAVVPQCHKAFHIRIARESDIPLLAAVERSAAHLFHTVDLGHLADGPTMSPLTLSSMQSLGHLWIAVDDSDIPVGFLCGNGVDDIYFHIAEVSVAKDFQGMGVGRKLIDSMIDAVRTQHWKAVTLTTYKHLRWNGPWYAKQGFHEVGGQELGKEHAVILETEAQHGHDMNQRCVMIREL
ncbi:putative acetyltransferase [Coleophoma cylindrospora]|uniref:Putative acetyltransferase n=1 Tax=Coleophoma cylindrospora TaxID=1849047 RepID=A0A3D8R5Y5_9HELO|nr:putative acetyltransferase [Coleophoma cylindrospora]